MPDDQGSTTLHAVDYFHKSCAVAKGHGVSRDTCVKTSRLPRYWGQCSSSNCTSPARACLACQRQGVENFSHNPATGLCEFHEREGPDVRISRDVLALVERANHDRMPSTEHSVVMGISRPRPLTVSVPAPPPKAKPNFEVVHSRALPPPPPFAAVVEEPIRAYIEPPPPPVRAVERPKKEPPPPPAKIEIPDEPKTSSRGQQILAQIRDAVASSTLITIDPNRVRPMPNQPRKYFNEERIASLSESMKQHGQFTPGMVRKVEDNGDGCDYELLDGERRQRAAIRGKLLFRATLVDINDEAAQFVISVIANFNREGHTPLELSDSIQRMNSDFGMTFAEIAEATGLSEAYLHQLHSLQNLVPEVRLMLDPEIVKSKRLPTTAAVLISKLKPHAQFVRAQLVLVRGITNDELRIETMDPQLRSPHVKSFTRSSRDDWVAIMRGAEGTTDKLSAVRALIKGSKAPETANQRQMKQMARTFLEDAAKALEECRALIGE